LLDGSNYEPYCNSFLHNLKDFNPSLFSIVYASICPSNINCNDFSEEEGKYLQLNAQDINLLTQSLSPNVEDLILREYGFPEDAHLLWKSIKEIFSEITIAQYSRGADCLIKPVRSVGQTGQSGLAKTASSKLQRRKRHRPNEESTSQTSSLPSTSHGKCIMAKDKKKKKSKKVESEKEDEYDLVFDKLSKKDMINIKRLFERLQE
jgi:hypothetical protein